MKLLVISHSCASPINQQLYAEVAQARGWDISLVVPSNWKTEYGNTCTVQRWPAFKGELIGIPVWPTGNIILHAYRASMRRLLRRIEPDAIYVNHEPYAVATAQVYLANRMTGRKPIGFYSCQNIAKTYPPPFRWSESFVLRESSFFFPISSSVEQVFRDKGYRGASTVLPLGIDPSTHRISPRADEVRRELQKSPAEFLVGYVGRVVPEKGMETLLKAMALLSDLPCRLVVVGSGPFDAEFDRLASQLGIADRVTKVGFVPHDKAPDYLSAFDVVVLPSETQSNWKEQFGRVILESLACGTPVIGSDSGEIPVLIRETRGGHVFPERQSDKLAECIRRCAGDPTLRQSVREFSTDFVLRKYSLASIAASFASTIESALAHPISEMPHGHAAAAK